MSNLVKFEIGIPFRLRNEVEVPVRFIGPAVIHAHEPAGIAALLVDDLYAPMGAAIVDDVDFAIGVPRHHNRLQTDAGA